MTIIWFHDDNGFVSEVIKEICRAPRRSGIESPTGTVHHHVKERTILPHAFLEFGGNAAKFR